MSKQHVLLLISLCLFQPLLAQDTSYSVTFILDAQEVVLSESETLWITGTMGDFGGADFELLPDSNNTGFWTLELDLTAGVYDYVYTTGSFVLWESELSGSACDANASETLNYRSISVAGDMQVTECWNCGCASVVLECADPAACNYFASDNAAVENCTYAEGNCEACENGSVIDNDSDGDGVCNADEVLGCTDSAACNYDESATDSGDCTYAESGLDCNGNCLEDADGDGICDADEILGCTSTAACNYWSGATDDDGSCYFPTPFQPCGVAHLSMLVDPNDDSSARFVRISNSSGAPVSLNGWQLVRYTNGSTEASSFLDLSALESLETEQCVYVAKDGVAFQTAYGFAPDMEGGAGGPVDSNGDDQIVLLNSDGVVIDIFGVIGEDGTHTCHEFEDGFAIRSNGAPDGDAWNGENWTIFCDVSDATGCFDHNVDQEQSVAQIALLVQESLCLQISEGCTDSFSCNYDMTATSDDGSCDYSCLGCTEVGACNYNADASIDDGSCQEPVDIWGDPFRDCDGNCLNDTDGDGVCDEIEIEGCTDFTACNYDQLATEDDGSCFYAEIHYDCEGNCIADADGDGICDALEVSGCTDESACNYDEVATEDDDSCLVPVENCAECSGQNLIIIDDDLDGICNASEIAGCQDPQFANFNPLATDEDDCLSCGADIDYHGYSYSTIQLGSACWFAENLRTLTYANGDTLGNSSDWSAGGTGATVVFGECGQCYGAVPNVNECDSEVSLSIFGRLYNFDAVEDERGLCPSGWYVSRHDDWIDVSNLADSLFGGYQGLKSIEYWNGNGTNASGLGLRPGGEGYNCNAGFQFAGEEGLFWSPDSVYNSVYARANALLLNRNDSGSLARSVRCVKEPVGCTDESACNFNPTAIHSDDSCIHADPDFDCDGQCTEDADGDGVCDAQEVSGCTDATAANYSEAATDDDGSCILEAVIFQVDMSNYPLQDGDVVNVTGGFDGWCGSCNPMFDEDGDQVYSLLLELTPGEYEYKFVINDWEVQEGWDDPGSLTVGAPCDYNPDDEFPNRGLNYQGGVVILDVVCFSSCTACPEPGAAGCTDGGACNYNPTATLEDGSCIFAEAGQDCDGNCLADVDGDGVCDGDEVAGCTDVTACNYDQESTDNDGTCEYNSCACAPDENGQVLVTFQVNMSMVDQVATDVLYVSGSFDGWCGTCYSMSDDDGDGVFTTEISLNPGLISYKYVVNGWGGEEVLPSGGCDDTQDDGYDNRELMLGTCPVTLEPVCFASCDTCEMMEVMGCTDPLACNYHLNANQDDGTCTYAASGYDCNGDCLSDDDGDGQCDNAEFVYIGDDYPTEFAWELIASNGNVVAGAGAGGALVPPTQHFFLEEDCYTLTVTDDYGDGICCAVGNGSYTLIVDGEVVAAGGEFEFEEVTTFCTTIDGCPDPEACNFSQAAFDNGSSDVTSCVFPDASNCEICVDGSAVSLGINADGDCNAACSNPFASNYNEAYTGALDECDAPESDLLVRGMIKHPHGPDAESGNAYLILDVLAPIADLSEYQVFSGPTGGSEFGGSLVSWTSPSPLPSGSYSAGDRLLLVQGASGTVEGSAAVIEQFYSTCGSNAHVVHWDDPASEVPSFYLAGTNSASLTPVLLLKGDSVVDMLGDFFVDGDENLRVVDFLYPGVGGLGFQEGFVIRIGDSNSVDFDLSDWALSDCACAVSWYGSCDFSYSGVTAAENLPCPSPVCGDVGCTDETACNYDSTATIPNNSCEYIDALGECGGTCVDADEDGECDREMIIRGLMNLPINDDYIGSPGFIHLEAVQDVASLSDFGLSNVTYDSWTDGFDLCAATPSPLALPDIPLNAGEHVLVAYTDYGEYAEQNATRLNEYLGEAQALFQHVIFPEYDGNDDWQSQAFIDHMVLWKGNQLLDGFGAIPLCANGYPQLTWPLPGESGAVYDVFSECHRWIYRQNVTPGPWTFSESDWWFNQCNTGVCNVVGPATAGNFCFNGTTPEHYPFLFQGCMDPGACNYDASVFIDNGSCAYLDADGDGVCDENEVPGCTNPEACNYNAEATEEDGSCLDPTLYDLETCQCFNDLNFNGVCDELESVGCTNPGACNYDPLADLDNGTCVYAAAGFDCSGGCTLLDADSTCLNAIEYVCKQHSVIAAEGDIYGGMPEDIPAFYAVTDQSDLSMWGATPTSPWLDSHPTQTEVNNNLGAIFSGAWGTTVLVDTAGTIMNPGEINAYGIFLPPMQNVVKVDNGEFQVLVLDEDGDVTSFAFDEGGSSFSPPFDVVLADIVDIACTMENNVAVDSEGEIHVWGAPWTIAELGYGMPTDMIGNWVAVDGTWSELVGVTDAGDAAIWPYDPSLTDHWKTLFNAYDWVADPAVDARISQNWACVLTQSGALIHFSSDSLLWNETTYEDLMPPASFGPVVDFDISTTGLIAKNANGQVHSAFSPTYSAEGETWWLESADFASSVPAVEFADPLCIPGCTDLLASNYSPAANLEDGNCLYEGCTDPTAFNYDPDAVDDDGSCITSGCVDEEACNYSAQAIYGLRLETVAVHEGMVGTADLTGFTTYRLYVDLPDSADFVSAIYGNDQDTLSLFSTGEFYQNVLGGVTPNGINPILFSAFPELEFDSWVTIGLEGVPGPGQQIISTVEDASAPWVFPFEMGNGFEINTLTGGSWYIINNGSASNGVAGADRSVLLGQFTTNGELYGELQIQYFPGGDGSNFEILSLPLENACSYAEPFYDCLGACLLDQDGDGICDELEVPGCMNPEACNFDPSATDEDGSCRISAATASIELEMVTEHNGMVGTDNLDGLTTYRLYATVDQPEDQVMAVYGDAVNALAIQSTGSFWQHPLGGITADGIQPALLGSFPGLAFDSYVTIGTTQFTPGNGVIELAESSDPVDQWLPSFIAGEDIQVSSVTGGGWYVVPGLEPYLNTLPDDSGRVLLGQFTTAGLMYGQLNLQIEACGVGTVQLVDLDFGASPELIGCTDPLACNFSEPAVEDDGSCCYAGCLEVYSEEVVLVDRQTGDTLVSVDRFDGTREFCLEDGCYVVSSAPGDSLNLNGEVFSMEFETLAISVGDVLCDGCKDERACNYAPEAVFDNGECALLPGDLDNPANGNVGISDLLFLLSEFGCNSDCSADVNGDGQVGAPDLLDMLGTFGDSCETVFMGCTDPSACNYDALNVLNDGSCTYPDGEGNCD